MSKKCARLTGGGFGCGTERPGHLGGQGGRSSDGLESSAFLKDLATTRDYTEAICLRLQCQTARRFVQSDTAHVQLL